MGQGYDIQGQHFGLPIFEAVKVASQAFPAVAEFRVYTARGKDLGFYKRVD